MSDQKAPGPVRPAENESLSSGTRRAFLRNVRGAAMVAATAGAIGIEPLMGVKESIAGAQQTAPSGPRRANESLELRTKIALQERAVPIPNHLANGDLQRYPDQANTYTKCLPHDAFGRVDLNSFATLLNALGSGEPADFEKIIMGGTRTLNGPQGGFAFDLEGTDGYQFGAPLVPPAPTLASDLNAAELLEHYWASLLRDVPFTQYDSNPIASAAAAEMSGLSVYQGPRNSANQVTPDLLFRGIFPGESLGPYVSQFYVTPTSLGQQPISQQTITYLPNIDFLADFGTWLTVQNGVSTGLANSPDPQPRYLHDGRGLAAWTHVDVLYQAYFVAFLVLQTIGTPLNPGVPYASSKTQNGFGTFGGPDFAATIGAVAKIALNEVWYQKWPVHLRHRPESGGGLVQLIKDGVNFDGSPDVSVFNSKALHRSYERYGSHLLSQAFF